MNKHLVISGLALLGLLAACSDMSNSGASGIADRSVGVANGGAGAHLDPTYQNELRAENSN